MSFLPWLFLDYSSDIPVQQISEVTVTITETSVPYDTEVYDIGEYVTYRLQLENTGNVNLTGLTVSLYCNGSQLVSPFTVNNLNVGQTYVYTNQLEVTETLASYGITNISCIVSEPPEEGVEKPQFRGYLQLTNITNDVDTEWSFTVDTTKAAASNTKASVPFYLYQLDPTIEFEIDWGDGSTSTITPASHTSTDSTASVHEYATGGEYTVTVSGKPSAWEKVYFSTMTKASTTFDSEWWNDKSAQLRYFKYTVRRILTKLPKIAGTRQFDNIGPSETQNGTRLNNDFTKLFYQYSYLWELPVGMFALNTDATSFKEAFQETKIINIPENMFYGCNKCTTWGWCFYKTTTIKTIPAGLFDYAEASTSFEYLFYGCTNIKTMPVGLFKDSPNVTTFWSAWKGCSNLTALPANLFLYTPKVTNFESAFAKCKKLTSIDESTFISCTGVTNFRQCFEECSGLTTLPQRLFQNCPNVEVFWSIFYKCTNLSSLPSDLFSYSTKITNISYALNGCSCDFDLTINAEGITTAAGFTTTASKTKIVRVPSGTTTQTSFNSVASSLHLTIIPE